MILKTKIYDKPKLLRYKITATLTTAHNVFIMNSLQEYNIRTYYTVDIDNRVINYYYSVASML